MQETKRFTAPDGKTILVEVNSARGNKSAVLMIHGFTGDVNEHIFHNASNTWPAKGYDTWRIHLYPGENKRYRKMQTVRWSENLADIDLILRKMSAAYKRLFIVGHSMGGVLAVYSDNQKVKAKILWDPALGFRPWDFKDNELHPDYHTLHWGAPVLVSKKYSQECWSASLYKEKLSPQPPILVIRAEDFFTGWPNNRLPAKVVLIKNSDHCFNREGNEKNLFRLTLNFFKKNNKP